MSTPKFRLEATWVDHGEEPAKMKLALTNLSGADLKNFRLSYTGLMRVKANVKVENATFVQRFANFHQFDPLENTVIADGETWEFTVQNLTSNAQHRMDGPKSGYVTLEDGSHVDVDAGDLQIEGRPSEFAGNLVPEGKLTDPIAVVPWPNHVAVGDFDTPPVVLCAAEGTSADEKRAINTVAALAKRLKHELPDRLRLTNVPGGRKLTLVNNAALASEAYELSFAKDEVVLTYGDKAGLNYGLITLSHMMDGAKAEPTKFKFPTSGEIKDAPRYEWRGSHLDVSRQFYPTDAVSRFIDILAWNKLNKFHWHLSDDEGWRVEIKGYPNLTKDGAVMGEGHAMPAQLGAGHESTGGFYTQEEIKELIIHGQALNVEIMPELDIPGHCNAVLAAYPELRDPEEPDDNYRSIQGYPNNAINPGIPATYKFIETVMEEISELFPSKYIHVGGDEVDENSWLQSPAAQKVMNEERLNGTMQLQAHFLGKVQKSIRKKGKIVGGWDEVSHGGGIDKEGGTLLFAWQKPEVGLELAEQGYDVVMTPGQAYYLDMAQSPVWQESGAFWAGYASPEKTYTYEAAGEFPDHLKGRLKGVQACIWSEHLISRQVFNHQVFPRLNAIAEAGWTEKENKDWPRFAAQCKMLPRL